MLTHASCRLWSSLTEVSLNARGVRGLSTGCHEPSVPCRFCAGLRRLRLLRRWQLTLLVLLLRVLARQLRTSLLAKHNTVALQKVNFQLIRGFPQESYTREL